mgnify:CR=1 FL=1
MEYPVKVTMPPALMRGPDKTWIVAGCMIQVPQGTTQEEMHKWVTYVPPAPPQNVWKISSSSGGSYTVNRWPNGSWTCSCPGHKFHKRCKHVTEAKKLAA